MIQATSSISGIVAEGGVSYRHGAPVEHTAAIITGSVPIKRNVGQSHRRPGVVDAAARAIRRVVDEDDVGEHW